MNVIIVGHEKNRDYLINICNEASGKSLLLTGPEMIGKRSVAEEVTHKILPDIRDHGYIFRVSQEEDSSSISIDQIRAVRDWLRTAAPDGVKRFVIIDNAHRMTIEAQNAILKTLEEPPRRTFFFLISHAPEILLPTVRSRLMNISFSPISTAQMYAFLETQQLTAEQKTYLAALSYGRVGLVKKIIESPDTLKPLITARNTFMAASRGERLLQVPELISGGSDTQLLCWLLLGRLRGEPTPQLHAIDTAYRSLQHPSSSPKLIYERLALTI